MSQVEEGVVNDWHKREEITYTQKSCRMFMFVQIMIILCVEYQLSSLIVTIFHH